MNALTHSQTQRNPMTRSISALALVVGGLLFGCGGMPEEGEMQGPQAAPENNVSQSAVVVASTTGVTVSYNSTNDTFTVQDTLNDGYDVVADIINQRTGATAVCWNWTGAGTIRNCDRNFPNNPKLSFRACVGSRATGSLYSCSPWTTANGFAPTK
jgi:hypothetical protein